MKKILISVVIALLCILAYFVLFRGVSIGSFKILSIEQIGNANDNLTAEIAQTELLMHSTYKTKASELETSIEALLKEKRAYLDLAQISTVGEIKGASQIKEYTTEFLMVKLGNYRALYGVDLKYSAQTITSDAPDLKNLLFEVTGDYIPIKDFIEALESDSDLEFRIYNFKMVPSGDTLLATFTVPNIKIKQELSSSTITETNNNNDNSTTSQAGNAGSNSENNTQNTVGNEAQNTTGNNTENTVGNNTENTAGNVTQNNVDNTEE